ncbi:histidine kinase [Spongisporangium articulatum]|uniref:histidine kinase n=1 Tax=Spongisporangium articulatum TaxID=3362603 RepID=A0ABW8AND3_9ACTN
MPTRLLPVATGLAVAALVVGGFALGLHVGNLHNGLIAASFTAVGLYVVQQRPGNRQGWLFVATGAAHAEMFAARQYALHGQPSGGPLPGASWVGWLGAWPLPLLIALIGVTVMSFPTGRLPSPRWRPAVALMVVVAGALSLAVALWPVEYTTASAVVPHPLHLPGARAAAHLYPAGRNLGYLLLQLVPVAALLVRLRRARDDEARQLRWFVYAVAVSAAVMVAGLVLVDSPLPGVLSVPLVAVAAGAAILKYRLYDIDPVINKTLVFGAMAAVVTLGYAAVVTGIGSLVDGSGTALSLLATALVAVAFEPMRRRVQRVADRIVYGHRATPYEALARLSAQLSSQISSPTGGLLDGMCAAVADGTGARRVVLWTGTSDELRAESAWPSGGELPHGPMTLAAVEKSQDSSTTVPVLHDGRFRGALAVTKASGEALSAVERRLLADLAAQAGLILELRAGAQRLVAAGDAARRRLERDLHDGAQQRLVMVAMELGILVDQAAETGDAELAARAEGARAHLLQATAELRRLAQGLHPAVLTQDGLEAAIGNLADRSGVPVRLDLSVGRRLAPEIEACAYFMISEALTNAVKHAGAGHVSVRAALSGDGLLVDVSDDGRGGASVRPGSGLEGLADRLATLGARLAVDSGPSGTRLATVIPCG